MEQSVHIRYLKGLVIATIGLSGLFYSSILMQGCDPISLMGHEFPSIYKSAGSDSCAYHTFSQVHDAIVSVAQSEDGPEPPAALKQP